MANDKQPAGQQKLHEIKNLETGETREVTQEEWRTNGKALRAEGFERTEDLGEVEEVPVDPEQPSVLEEQGDLTTLPGDPGTAGSEPE